MKKRFLLLLSFTFLTVYTFAQTGILRGRVFEEINNESIPFANVVLQGTQYGTTTDDNGKFEFKNLEPGLYNIQVSFIGYRTKVVSEIRVTNVTSAELEIRLVEDATVIEEVELVANPFETREESPTSVQKIGVNEIQRNPGANQDISQVVQSLPGVASTPSFRNDLIIRGGAPNENRFYVDGIEIPTINHFSTQGGSGGPVGIININLIEGVELYTGAFPVERGNMLSSVMEIDFKDGRSDKLRTRFQVGASEVGVTVDGPLGEKTTIIGSVRRSYLQFLFDVLGLPFLPTYNDASIKIKHRINDKNELTFLTIGAYDVSRLNLDANETESQRYLLNNLPEQDQWNYTTGIKYTNYRERGFTNVVLSRSYLFNGTFKYQGNIVADDRLILDYESKEIENKLRVETISRRSGWKFLWGAGAEYVRYTVNTFNRLPAAGEVIEVNQDAELRGLKYGLFASASRKFGRWSLSGSLRSDGFDYSSETSNPLRQISPRFAAKYYITDEFSVNFNTGIYYQLPPYTVLGFQDSTGAFVNRDNGITYVRSGQVVGGVSYLYKEKSKFSLEAFYKSYDNYPFLTRDSLSLANLGGDFGVVGNEPAVPTGEGRAYGLEFLYQQKLAGGFYGLLSYTFVRSEFTDKNGDFIPSSWDNRHLVSLVGGKKFKNDWEIGVRWRLLGGAPFTPFDQATTALIPIWDVTGRGIPDYDRLNSERLGVYHQLDLRIDKKWFFEKWNLNLYFDIQNAYGFELEAAPFLDVVRDDQGNPVVDPNDPNRYQLRTLENSVGTVLPSIGVIIDF
jgi:hypothetical protein